MTQQKTKREELDSIMQHASQQPEADRNLINMYAEEIRDMLNEGQGNALTAMAIVSCEVAVAADIVDEDQGNG